MGLGGGLIESAIAPAANPIKPKPAPVCVTTLRSDTKRIFSFSFPFQ